LPTNKLHVLSKSSSHSQECSATSLGVGVLASTWNKKISNNIVYDQINTVLNQLDATLGSLS